jgi:NAD(P)-dependent dehydrogenase (short-subunit alcohol dehydrogenase family)
LPTVSGYKRGDFGDGYNDASKVALITGGGSGIGRAASVAFARAGAKVVIGDVVEQGGNRTVELIRDIGGEALFVRTDVTVGREVERLVKAAVDTYGGLDCAYNNAGIEGAQVGIVDCTEEEWQRVIAVDLTAVWRCVKHEIPAMLKRGRGSIVNTSSVMGLVGAPKYPGLHRQQAWSGRSDQSGGAGIRQVRD